MSELKVVLAVFLLGLTCAEARASTPPVYFCTDPFNEKSCGPLTSDETLLHVLPGGDGVCMVRYSSAAEGIVAGCTGEAWSDEASEPDTKVYVLCDIPQGRVAFFSFKDYTFSLVCAGPVEGEVSL